MGIGRYQTCALVHQYALAEPRRRAYQTQPTTGFEQCIDEPWPRHVRRGETRNRGDLNLRGGFCTEDTRVEAYGHSEVSLIRINPLRTRERSGLDPFRAQT